VQATSWSPHLPQEEERSVAGHSSTKQESSPFSILTKKKNKKNKKRSTKRTRSAVYTCSGYEPNAS
jgi:hypothetical protein